ncbi:hypothetical protein RHMOL_Rhmol05G0199300 [Rhododendron molle]|uniref:Uncharacterized protein n=1 Tax=Rhododendron molle TaxID=49168 RepID=A0ACC0NSH7_RHOML|nr:hypothetical protein RHMOL_Rhmol05G0199300 [Rhododendron molle]
MMKPEYEKVMDEFSRNLGVVVFGKHSAFRCECGSAVEARSERRKPWLLWRHFGNFSISDDQEILSLSDTMIPPGFGANQLPNFSGDSAKVSPLRQNNSHGGATHKRKGVPFVDLDPQQPVLSVAPLNSVPYTGPPLSPVQRETDPTVSNEPALVFLPSRPYEEEWNNIIAATKRGVGLTGSAARGKVGAIIGLMNIGEGEETFLFRVSLPGVAADKSTFSCDIEPTGKVVIKGITATGERIVRRHSQVFEMRTRNLCPPGHFSVSFELPGPVDEQRCTLSFGVDGILEGSVKKRALDGS